MRLSLLPVLACTAVFLQGCACSMKEDMADLQKENLDLYKDLVQSEIYLHDKNLEITLLKKDMEIRNTRNEEKKKEMEKKIAELEAELARSISIDLFFKGSSGNSGSDLPSEILNIWLTENLPPGNPTKAQIRTFAEKLPVIAAYCKSEGSRRNELPPEILDIWLKDNMPPEKPTKAQLRIFAEKLPAIARSFNYEGSRRKLQSLIDDLPEDFLKELIRTDRQGSLSFIFEDAARKMDKKTLKEYMQLSEGRSVQWTFTNRLTQLVDKDDKEFILARFWNNQLMQKKAIEYGFYKEILPQIKERVQTNILQYPDLAKLVLPEFTEEEKHDMLDRAWKQMAGQNILHSNNAKTFLENGFVPAFEQIGLFSPYIRNNYEAAIIEKYSPVRISELQDWVIKNKGNIVFDSKTRKFTAGNKADQK